MQLKTNKYPLKYIKQEVRITADKLLPKNI